MAKIYAVVLKYGGTDVPEIESKAFTTKSEAEECFLNNVTFRRCIRQVEINKGDLICYGDIQIIKAKEDIIGYATLYLISINIGDTRKQTINKKEEN